MVIGPAIAPETTIIPLLSQDRDSVLAELVGCIPVLRDRPEDQEILLRALQEREQLCSTGIGEGVALPHARNALVGLIPDTVLVMGRHPRGIPFGSIDSQPARLFFLLVAPTVSQHLRALARLSRLLRDARLRQALLAADGPRRAIEILRAAEAAEWGASPA